MFKAIAELSKEIRGRLTSDLQEVFMVAYNVEEDAGKTESECLRAGWTAVVSQHSRVVHDTFLFQPGNWNPAKGDGKITDQNAQDAIFAINRCEAMGVPLQVIYKHTQTSHSIPIGIARNVVGKPGNKGYGDVYIYQDAREDSDGKGSKILATVDQIADALLTDGMKVSIEAFRDVEIPAYYGDRIISLEPSALAVLPAGVQPAIVEKIVAGREGKKRFAFMASETRGEEDMTIEELAEMMKAEFAKVDARLTALEPTEEAENEEADETVAALQKTIDEQKVKLDAIETEKVEAEVKELTEKVEAKLTFGEVEKLKEDLGDAVSLSEKKVVLARLDSILEELPETQRVLKAGRQTDAKTKNEKFKSAVDARVKETGEDRLTAQRALVAELDDSDIETKEVNI